MICRDGVYLAVRELDNEKNRLEKARNVQGLRKEIEALVDSTVEIQKGDILLKTKLKNPVSGKNSKRCRNKLIRK
jgi:hypothetical protein